MRRRLLLLAAATTSMVLVAFLIPLAVLMDGIAQDRAVTVGLREAQNVAAVAAAVSDESELSQVVTAVNKHSDRRTTILLPDGKSVGPYVDPDSANIKLARSGRAITVKAPGGGRVILVPVLGGTGESAVVRTLVPASMLDEGVGTAILVLVLVGLGLLIVALLVADWLGRRTVRQVSALARTAQQLATGNLDARVAPDGPPEIVEVGTALNRLAGRIRDLLNYEREAVADLSHRLRTPVAAIRLTVDTLPPSPEAERLAEQVEALQRSVGDVIREARRPVREGVDASCDVIAVVAARVRFWAVLAEDQGRALDVQLPAAAQRVRVGAQDLSAAVDALLENVFAHTPEGTPMSVAVEIRPGEAAVVVSDAGPGLSHRSVGRGHSGGGSTGLGLDIVRRTAEAADGRLDLEASPAGGARITMVLAATGDGVRERRRGEWRGLHPRAPQARSRRPSSRSS